MENAMMRFSVDNQPGWGWQKSCQYRYSGGFSDITYIGEAAEAAERFEKLLEAYRNTEAEANPMIAVLLMNGYAYVYCGNWHTTWADMHCPAQYIRDIVPDGLIYEEGK